MRIGIDARFWGTFTGIGRYVEELFLAILKEDQNKEFVLFLSKENWDLPPEDKRITKVLAPAHWYTLSEQMALPKIFDKANCDLIHFPHWNVPLLVRTPFVLTIHDLLLLDFPTRRASLLGPLVYALKYLGFRVVLRSAIRRAKAIITPSEFTRERLKNFSPSAAGKVNVINEGVVSLRGEAENEVIEKRGIEKPYLLYVGNAYPHKNLEILIKAVLVLNELGKKFKLVLVGREDEFYARLKKKFGHKNFVTFYGKAEEGELRRLYKNAHAYVFPSLQEGFGLPGLEAMAQGAPVVAANAGALKEVYGDAANYFDPRDVRSLVKAILALDEPEVRERLKFNGFKQIAKYNWQNAAKNTLALYEKTEEKIKT